MSDEGAPGSDDGRSERSPRSSGMETSYLDRHSPTSDTQPPAGRREGQQNHEDETSWTLFARDLITSALAVVVVGAYLFTISGVWPPLVAIESPSMTPNMHENDLVFVMDEARFPGNGAVGETGIVTAAVGETVGYSRFGGPGDVIIYQPNGDAALTPIIHRAMLYVERGENWYDRADPDYVGGAESCEELRFCPANSTGFITKGDANGNYDQVTPSRLSGPVEAEWIIGTAEVRVPGLGWLRLRT